MNTTDLFRHTRSHLHYAVCGEVGGFFGVEGEDKKTVRTNALVNALVKLYGLDCDAAKLLFKTFAEKHVSEFYEDSGFHPFTLCNEPLTPENFEDYLLILYNFNQIPEHAKAKETSETIRWSYLYSGGWGGGYHDTVTFNKVTKRWSVEFENGLMMCNKTAIHALEADENIVKVNVDRGIEEVTYGKLESNDITRLPLGHVNPVWKGCP